MMNILERYMKSEPWINFMKENGGIVYACYHVNNHGYSKEDYLDMLALDCMAKKHPHHTFIGREFMNVSDHYETIERCKMFASAKEFTEEVKEVKSLIPGGSSRIERTFYVDGKEYGGYCNIEYKYSQLLKFIKFKRSKYQKAMIKSGFVTEDDIREALKVEKLLFKKDEVQELVAPVPTGEVASLDFTHC